MTRKDMLAMLRRVISDEQATGYTENGNLEEPSGEAELLNYLDRAVDEWSRVNVSRKNPLFMKNMLVSDGTNMPDDFIAFCGAVPVAVEGRRMHFYGPNTAHMPVMYWARLPYVTEFAEDEVLSYAHDDYMKIIGLAAVYALNKHEFTVSQDMHLLGLGGSALEGVSN